MVSIHGGRWLVVSQYYPPEIGAPQIRLRAMVKELRKHGIEVKVLTALPNYPAGEIFPEYKGKRRVHEEIDGVSVTRTWVYPGTGKSAFVRLANYFSFTMTALWTALWGPRPDVLFVESQPMSLGVVALLMKWLRSVPYIYNVPDLQIEVAQQLGFMKNKGLLRLALGLENLMLRQSWKVSTVTHRFIDHFEARGIPRSQITFLPNGADTEFLRPLAPSAELLDRWHLHGKRVFLYVGTHAYYHGLDTLLEAAALLRDRPDVAFLMIGDGPERQRLRQMASDLGLDHVIFGESPYEEMDQLYSIAYTSIATLRNVEVANRMRLSKIFPSLSCGVPVLYAGVGEAADLIRDSHCGVVVPPENPALLAEAVVQLFNEPIRRDALGRAGRRLVLAEYSWSVIVERWIAEVEAGGEPVARSKHPV